MQIPPIKSQGIKTKLVPWIRELVPVGFSGRWIEPFMGTGVVGLNLATGPALMTDLNPHLVNFYSGIADGTIDGPTVRAYLVDEGRALLEKGEEHYYFVRSRFNSEHHPLDFLFLSRAGFNGMIRFNRKGGYNIPFCRKPERFAPSYVTKIVNQVDAVSSIIRNGSFEFKVQDFEATISAAKSGDIIYCDPPYIGRHVDYFNGWSESDERRLHRLLTNSPAEYIMSTWVGNKYRRNDFLAELWSDANILTQEHFYHVGGKVENRGSMTEALVFSPGLAPSEVVQVLAEPVGALS